MVLQECGRDDEASGSRREVVGGYAVVGSCNSFSGRTVLLMSEELLNVAEIECTCTALPGTRGSFVLVALKDLSICGVHFAPRAEGAAARFSQFKNVVEAAGGSRPLVVAGDTNMRNAEELLVERLGFEDAFVSLNFPRACKYTLDWERNKFYNDFPPITCRYDRILCRQQDTPTVKPADMRLYGDVELEAPGHYVSDHFALWVKYELNSRQSPSILQQPPRPL